MPEQPFDVRKVIEQSASKTTLQELARKGIHRVKVLDEQMVNKLIHEAVAHVIGSKTNLLSDADREKLLNASRQELDRLMRESNQAKDRAELLATDKNTLAAEVENLQKQLQVQRQLGDQLGKQALDQGKAIAKGEIEELKRRADEAASRAARDKEAEFTQKLMDEMRKNVDLSQKLARTLEDMRARDDEVARKMEALFTKSIEALSGKMSEMRVAAGGAALAGADAGDPFRPSSDAIAHMLGQELESNIKTMEPAESKTAGRLGGALEKLRAMRGSKGGKSDEPAKK